MKILKCIENSSSGLIYFSKDMCKDYSRHYGGYFKNRFELLGEISLDNKLLKLVLILE